jgi:hypothetical protein
MFRKLGAAKRNSLRVSIYGKIINGLVLFVKEILKIEEIGWEFHPISCKIQPTSSQEIVHGTTFHR